MFPMFLSLGFANEKCDIQSSQLFVWIDSKFEPVFKRVHFTLWSIQNLSKWKGYVAYKVLVRKKGMCFFLDHMRWSSLVASAQTKVQRIGICIPTTQKDKKREFNTWCNHEKGDRESFSMSHSSMKITFVAVNIAALPSFYSATYTFDLRGKRGLSRDHLKPSTHCHSVSLSVP